MLSRLPTSLHLELRFAKKMKLDLVGGIPQQVGGVTVFILRVAQTFPGMVKSVIDLYPTARKESVAPVHFDMMPSTAISRMIWFVYKIFQVAKGDTYFNFSSTSALCYLFFLPKLLGRKWLLTLHHGKLNFDKSPIGSMKKIMAFFALRRFNRIGYLSSNQRSFYVQMGVREDRLFSISSYLPSNVPATINERMSRRILTSGFGTDIYRHDWILEYLAKFDPSATAVFCLYGPQKMR